MKPNVRFRPLPFLVVLSLSASVFGCGKSPQASTQAPSGAPYGYVPPPQQQQRTGMSTGKKVAIIAGAAALIYLYNKHKNAKGSGAQGQYYLSKNGRVYYRDAKGNAIWVTPPKQGIQVPQEDAQMYERAAQNNNWNVGTFAPASRPVMSGSGMGGNSMPPGPPGPRR